MDAGLTRHMVAGMITRGRLRREHQGVYAVGHTAAIPLGRETAALLACRGHAAISGASAAAMWELGRPGAERDPVEVTILDGATIPRHAGISVRRSRLITPRDALLKEGLPVTSPAWTLLDRAAVLGYRDSERTLEEALARRLVSLTKLRELLARTDGHLGHGVLARLLARRGPSTVTRSEAEERMLALVRAARLPAPELNAQVCGFEVDLYWPAQRLVVEVDGYRWHSGRAAFERDRRKGVALAAAGIDLVRVSWEQMERDALAVIAALATRLALPQGPLRGESVWANTGSPSSPTL